MSDDHENDPESLLEFPCDFPVKALGRSDCGLDVRVVEIVRRHVTDLYEGAVRIRPSAKGKYTAVTVTIRATSMEQIHAIYRDLNACVDVLMTL